MAENGNLNNNNINNFNNTHITTTREFINRSTATTTTSVTNVINSTTFSGTNTTIGATTNIVEPPGFSERDATHFRLRDGVTQGFEYLTCSSCGGTFKSSTNSEVYEHYRERPYLRHYVNCLYCQGKVHQYYNNRLGQVKFDHNCLRWKRNIMNFESYAVSISDQRDSIRAESAKSEYSDVDGQCDDDASSISSRNNNGSSDGFGKR